jgi:hypothetical protein
MQLAAARLHFKVSAVFVQDLDATALKASVPASHSYQFGYLQRNEGVIGQYCSPIWPARPRKRLLIK